MNPANNSRVDALRPVTWAIAVSMAVLVVCSSESAWAACQHGDTDADGDVDIDDFNNSLNNLFATGPADGSLAGDTCPFDGFVDFDDRKRTLVYFGTGDLVAGPAPVSGSSMEITPAVSAVLLDEEDFPEAAWFADGSGGVSIMAGQGAVFAIVDFYMAVDGVGRADAVGWGNANFHVNVTNDVTNAFGWIADVTTVDHDGIPSPVTPEIPLFTPNQDQGIFGDSVDIVVGVATYNFGPEGVDPRRTVGQEEPVRIGSVLARIDSNAIGSSGTVEAVIKAFSTYDENLLLGRNDGDMTGGLVTISVPEADCIPGDTRLCDGRVNIDDLNRLRNNFGATGPADGTLTGDTFPFDGVVNTDDLNNIRNQFGAQAAPAPVPEPATWLSLICGIVFYAATLRGARRQT